MEAVQWIKKVPHLFTMCFGILVFGQTTYSPNEQLRTTIRKKVWSDLKTKTPKKQKFMTGLLMGSNQFFGLFEEAAKKRGWEPYDAPTVVTFYKVILQETIVARDFTETEIKSTYETVKEQFANAGLDKDLNDTALQTKYDPLIIKALWIGSVFELAKKKEPSIQEIASQLLKDFEGIGVTDASNTSVAERTIEKPAPKEIVTTPKVKKESNSTLEVEDVILRTVTNYGLSGMYIDNEVSVLFNNGEILTNPSKALESLNVSASKAKHPKKWNRWERKGNTLMVTKAWKGKTYEWKKWFQLRKGNPQTKLKGVFKTLDPFGGDRVINASIVAFDAQGRFAWKTFKGGNTAWKPIYAKQNSAGTYTIDGYKITLRYNNGVTEQLFFGFYPKDDAHFVIGSGHFLPQQQ